MNFKLRHLFVRNSIGCFFLLRNVFLLFGRQIFYGLLAFTLAFYNVVLADSAKIIWHDDCFVKEGRLSTDVKQAISIDSFNLVVWDIQTESKIYDVSLESFFKQYVQIHGASVSPKLDVFIIATNGTLYLFNLKNGKQRWSINTELDLNKFVWSEDGKFIVVSSEYHSSAKVINTISGEIFLDFKLPKKNGLSIESIAITHKNNMIFAGTSNEGFLYNLNSGRVQRSIERHGIFFGASFSPDGLFLATAMGNNEVCLWEVETGKLVRSFQGHQDLVLTVVFSNDGSLLASAGQDKTIRIWDIETGRQLDELKGHSQGINGLNFGPQKKVLISVANDNTSRVWNIEKTISTKEIDRTLPQLPTLSVNKGHTGGVTATALSENGKFLATGDANGNVELLHTNNGNVIKRFMAHPGLRGEIIKIFIAFNQKAIVTASRDGKLSIWDILTGKRLLHINTNHTTLSDIALINDGERILTASEDGGSIIEWNGRNGNKIRTVSNFYERDQGIFSLSVLQEKGRIAAAKRDGTVTILDLKNSKELQNLLISEKTVVNNVVITSDGKHIATSSLNGQVGIWELNSEKLLYSWNFPGNQIFALEFAPDQNRLFVGLNNGEVHIYSIKHGNHVHSLPQFKKMNGWSSDIRSICFSTKKDIFAISSGAFEGESGYIKLFEAEQYKLINDFSSYVQIPVLARYSPDEHFIIVDGKNGTTIWDLETGKVLKRHKQTIFKPCTILSKEGSIAVPLEETVRIFSEQNKNERTITIPRTNKYDFGFINYIAIAPKVNKMLIQRWGSEEVILHDYHSGKILEHYNTGIVSFPPLFTPAEDAFLTVTHHNVVLWDINSNKSMVSIEKKDAFIGFERAVFTQNGEFAILYTQGLTGSALVLDMKKGEIIRSFSEKKYQIHNNSYWVVDSPPKDPMLLDYGKRGKITIINPTNGEIKQELVGGGGDITAVSVSGDGRLIAIAGEERNICIWRLNDGVMTHTFQYHSGRITSLVFSNDGKRILSASDDGSVGVWKLSNGALIANLFDFDNSWVVVNPEGYFDTDRPESIPGLSWIMPDDPLTPIPIEIFLRDYFKPYLLPQILTGGKFKQIRDLKNLNRIQPKVKILSVRQADSPTEVNVNVEVESVTTTIRENGKKKKVMSGVHDLRIYRQGRIVSQWPKNNKDTYKDIDTKSKTELIAWRKASKIKLDKNGKAIKTFTVKIPRNTNLKETNFSAYAFNSDRVKSNTSSIVYQNKTKISKGKRCAHVIAVGISNNQDFNWRLGFAAEDAKLIQQKVVEHLKSEGQYDKVNKIGLITSPPDFGLLQSSQLSNTEDIIQPTKDNIKLVIDILSGKAVRPDLLNKIPQSILLDLKPVAPEDMIILSFSCHGVTSENGEFYLIPYDIGSNRRNEDKSVMLSKAISSQELSSWLISLDAELLMIIDTCHSASAIEINGFKPAPLGNLGLGQLSYDKKMPILTASTANEVAWAKGYSLLSYAFAYEGIGEKKAAKHGKVTLRDALHYAVDRVPMLYKERIRNEAPIKIQTPKLFDFNKSL
nr:PQQ-binding-like beta-propeller repeat protein [uncultured Desulfobacter sp.]